ncbi:helix-turn-helix domain-containing protein [Candidatus Poribacteria bacterium]|nr:helix-turn-helix domain-containing protein [Candidatus Poribacteria bacterium]
MEKEMIYTTNEVAEILKVTPLTIRRLVGNGKLKACKVGRLLRFRLTDIETYLNGEINSTPITDKALKFRQLAGKWAGSKDEVEAIKRAIKESKSEAEF